MRDKHWKGRKASANIKKICNWIIVNFLDTWVKLHTIYLLNNYLYMSKRHNVPERVIMLEIGKLPTYMEHMHPDRWYISDGTDINAFDHQHSFMGLLLSYPFYGWENWYNDVLQDHNARCYFSDPQNYTYFVKVSIFLNILALSCTLVFEPMLGHEVNKILEIQRPGNYF